jgi:hypothetical protein
MIYMKILKKGGGGGNEIHGKQLNFHISRHIAHLGWETPMFFLNFLPCLHMALSHQTVSKTLTNKIARSKKKPSKQEKIQ